MTFEDVDFVGADRYSSLTDLRASFLDARAKLMAQVAFRLDKAITLDDFTSALAVFDGSIEYAYGTMSGSDDLCVLVSFRYTPGTRIAHAYKTGQYDILSDAESRVLNAALECLQTLGSEELWPEHPLLIERKIHDYLCANMRYFDDKTNNSGTALRDYQTAIGAFDDKRGNCMAYADAFLMLARMAGFECDTIIGEAKNENGEWIGHAWNMIRIDEQWLMCDVTYDDLDSPPFTRGYAYFNIDELTIKPDHRWAPEAMYRPVASESSERYGFGNSEFPDLKTATSESGFRTNLESALSAAYTRDAWFMLEGFSVTIERIQEWMQDWDWSKPGGWLMIHQELGANQYWTFHIMD
jgi:hypothetical protein